MRETILIIILGLFSFITQAQNNVLQHAIQQYQSGKIEEAKTSIDKATEEESLLEEPTLWYLRGFIYKDLYKRDPEADSSSIHRKEAVHAFEKLVTMPNTQKYQSDCIKNLTYLASTFYNDAITAMNIKNFKGSTDYFKSFKNTITINKDPNYDLNKYEIDYFLALGTKYSEVYKTDTTNNKVIDYLSEALTAYQNVLVLDSGNVKANYNLGVLYYNEAVNIINELDYDEMDLTAFSEIEDKSIDLFKQSLPYMNTAYQLNPMDRNVIEGLAGIYFSLREYDKSNELKAKLEELDK